MLRELRDLVQPPLPVPRPGGWAASPETLRELVTTLMDTQPRLVVECGSGVSSLWIGHALRRVGSGRCVALEHEEEFAARTREQVAEHGLQDLVDVRLAPLTEVEVSPQGQRWYAPDQVADLHDIGLVFVDGPPGHLAPLSRYPAVPLLVERCRPGAWFLLDDAARPEERKIADLWQSGYGLTSERQSAHDTGWHLLAVPGA